MKYHMHAAMPDMKRHREETENKREINGSLYGVV